MKDKHIGLLQGGHGYLLHITGGCLIQVTNTAFVLSKNSDFETGCLIDGGH